MKTYFFVFRIILGLCTGIFMASSLPCIITVHVFSILQLAFHLKYSPMSHWRLNMIENANLFAIYILSYSMLIFTEWADIEAKYEMGFFFMYFSISVCAINILIIFFDIFSFINISLRQREFEKLWKEYDELKADMIQ